MLIKDNQDIFNVVEGDSLSVIKEEKSYLEGHVGVSLKKKR